MSGMAEVPIHATQHGTCECSHSFAAHGTNGIGCGACPSALSMHTFTERVTFTLGCLIPITLPQTPSSVETPVPAPVVCLVPASKKTRRMVSADGSTTIELWGSEKVIR